MGAIANSDQAGAPSSQTTVARLITSKRPKLFSFGNSLNGRNQLGETAAGGWSAWSPINQMHQLMGAPFDRCRSIPFNWGAQGNPGGAETIDQLGAYAWGGATISAGSTYNMLNHLLAACRQLIDVPDIVYMFSHSENDLSQAFTSAQIILALSNVIQLFRQLWPNALIIIATPSPNVNYNTVQIHANVAAVVAFITGLPATDPHILVEQNIALIAAGTADQPIANTTDGVHPNERGAFMRARAFVGQFAYLFPNKLVVPTVKVGYFSTNPDYSLTGNPGSLPPSPPVNPTIIQGIDFYTDTNYSGLIGYNAVGGGFTFAMTASGAVASGLGVAVTSDAQAATINAADAYMFATQIKILNPTNFFGVAANFVNAQTSTNYAGNYYQGTFPTNFPQGLSDLYLAGDTLTLTSPPLLATAANTTCYGQTKLLGASTLPVGSVPGASNPSIQLIAQNIVQVFQSLPSTYTIASAATYTNKSGGVQQMVIGGTGTFTAMTITRGTLTVSMPLTATQSINLAPGDILTPTYTGAPTFTVLQLN